MTLPRAALVAWADAIASPDLVRTGATRHVVPFEVCVDLDEFAVCDWPDAGFTVSKLAYLRRRYPPAHLPSDGCIAELTQVPRGVGMSRVTYRRVDCTRGWLADVLYLRWLGWRGQCLFSGVGGPARATLHAVNASAVAPAVHAAGLWRGAHPTLRRTLRRAIVHRMERRHEARAATRRVNDWAHRLARPEQMWACVEALDAQAT